MSEPNGAADALICAGAYLFEALGTCWACEIPTRMFAVMALPPFSYEGEEEPPMDEDGALLSHLNNPPPNLAAEMVKLAGNLWREDHSRTAGESYFMSHCEHCDAKQGDHFVQGPGGAFWPDSHEQMDAISALRVDGPFRLVAPSTSCGPMSHWRERHDGGAKAAPAPYQRAAVPKPPR